MFSTLCFPLQVSLLSSENWRGLVETKQFLPQGQLPCRQHTVRCTIKSRARQFLRRSLAPRGIPMTFLSFSFSVVVFLFIWLL